MTSWNIILSATLDRPVPQQQALGLGRSVAGDHLLSVAVHDHRFSITRTAPDDADLIHVLGEALAEFEDKLTENGYKLVTWEGAECLSAEELERRAAAASLPALVTAKEFAELAGVATQRIYELESERSKAAERGERHPFPAPLVKGYWIKTAAERWATTRKRKPGPAPRSAKA